MPEVPGNDSKSARLRLAAIDIGTNSIRLIVAEATPDGQYRILDDEKEALRLGRNLNATGRLDPQAVDRALDALRRMKQIVQGFGVQQLRAIGTCALREAEDGPEFCRRAREEVGLEIEVITGEEEARLALAGALRAFDLHDKNYAVVDIGGGSAEVVLASGSVIEEIYSTTLGAVRITERFGGHQSMDSRQFDSFLRRIDKTLERQVTKPLFVPHVMIGSGGTFAALAAMVMAEKGQTGLPVQAYHVTRAELHRLLNRLRKMSPKARRGVTGLSVDRADIIVAGLAVVDRIMQWLRVNVLQVHTGGVRDGLLLTMVRHWQGNDEHPAHDLDAAIDQLAERCGVDLEHCRHVAYLAGSIYSQLVKPYRLPAQDQVLLETAARLQDVGYLINYDEHHKHSYHLILNSRLAGMRARELELIANVARYHRGALPKKRHENFNRLSRKERQRVRIMAAVLRLAGGLDRSHSQQIRDVDVVVRPGAIELRLHGDQLPEVDVWGTRQRAVMFEKVFDTKLRLVWDHDPLPPLGGEPKLVPAETSHRAR